MPNLLSSRELARYLDLERVVLFVGDPPERSGGNEEERKIAALLAKEAGLSGHEADNLPFVAEWLESHNKTDRLMSTLLQHWSAANESRASVSDFFLSYLPQLRHTKTAVVFSLRRDETLENLFRDSKISYRSQSLVMEPKINSHIVMPQVRQSYFWSHEITAGVTLIKLWGGISSGAPNLRQEILLSETDFRGLATAQNFDDALTDGMQRLVGSRTFLFLDCDIRDWRVRQTIRLLQRSGVMANGRAVDIAAQDYDQMLWKTSDIPVFTQDINELLY